MTDQNARSDGPSALTPLPNETTSAASPGRVGAEEDLASHAVITPLHPLADTTIPLRLPWWVWLREGLRATVFLPPRTGAARPTAVQLLVLALFNALLTLACSRLEVAGPASFDARGWLAPMGAGLGMLWCAWWAMEPTDARSHGGLGAWYVLSNWAPWLPALILYGLGGWSNRQPEMLLESLQSNVFWLVYGLVTLWLMVAFLVVSARFIASRLRLAVFAAVMLATVGAGGWIFSEDRAWHEDTSDWMEEGDAPEELPLSQEVFEAQLELWQRQVHALEAERPGVTDVYGLVFAPYAGEEVFRREGDMVREVLEQRFEASGRLLYLLNHAQTADTHAWATPQNLRRAVEALGARMDRERDVLVVYLTSHGAADHVLAAANPPLEVESVTPELLHSVLEDAGIRHRVVAVSACYSGGWIEPLANDHSLIMTAADATHTSYGCGTRSELTFFGRAVFHEQLRQTRSFGEAFANAVPLIAEREIEAGKDDGFSNPQIHIGAQIAGVLKGMEKRLDAAEKSTALPAQAAPRAMPSSSAAK